MEHSSKRMFKALEKLAEVPEVCIIYLLLQATRSP